MMNRLKATFAGILMLNLLQLCSCQSPVVKTPPVLFTSSDSVKRSESLMIAEGYLNHRWHGEQLHIQHGPDAKGIQVDTPDENFKPPGKSPGWWKTKATNVSIPYCWGGFDTPDSFDAALRQGKWAGDICTEKKRAMLDNAVSLQTAGIDCSGFISRCWRLSKSYSTREMPQICDPLPNWDDLKPGDALNLVNKHVLLFAGFTNPEKSEILVYETGCPPTWKVMKHTTSVPWLKGLGYEPWRYRGIEEG